MGFPVPEESDPVPFTTADEGGIGHPAEASASPFATRAHQVFTEAERDELAKGLTTDGLDPDAISLLLTETEDAGQTYWRRRRRRSASPPPPAVRARKLEKKAAALEGGRAHPRDVAEAWIEETAALDISLRRAGLLPPGGPRDMARADLAALLRDLAGAVRGAAPARWDEPFEALLGDVAQAWRRHTGKQVWVSRDARTGDLDSPFRRFLLAVLLIVDRKALRERSCLVHAIGRFRRDERDLFEPDGPDPFA